MPKDLQYLSKRRKNQLIHGKIESYRNTNISSSSNPTLNTAKEISNSPIHSKSSVNINNDETIGDNFACSYSSDSKISSSNSLVVENYEDVMQTQIVQYTVSSSLNFPAKINNIENVENNIEQNVGSNGNKNENSLESSLQSWVNAERISYRSVNKLLKILRNNGHKTLPQDARMLMHTPRNYL